MSILLPVTRRVSRAQGEPVETVLLFPVYIGVLIWGGLFLRDDRLRALSRCEVAQYEVAKEENDMQKITPFLWFDDKAEEAANFYTSIFKNSKILNIARYGEAGPGPKGTVMTVTFQLEGQEFMALNGGPHYTFSPAISFFVNCETQAEVDELWEKLTAGGREVQCAWLKDKFGVSWQIVPKALLELIAGQRPGKIAKGFQSHAANDQDRYRRLEASLSGE